MSEFFEHWFRGCTKGLTCMKKEEQETFFHECGKACSESYSLNVYKKIREESDDISDFFQKINNNFQVIQAIEIKKDKLYEIHYNECLCDLYTNGYIKDGIFCECSRASLQYNLEHVFPEQKITIVLVGSILRGDEECILQIEFGEGSI